MTSKNSTAKAVVDETTEGAEAEASVPQQNSGEKVTRIKGGGVDGKDLIVIADEDEETSSLQKFKALIRNKKVLAGLSAVATMAIIAIAKNVLSNADAAKQELQVIVEDDEITD